jgi:hypothetical protein
MAKAGIVLGFKPFTHTDPVTGEHKEFLRTAHSRQTSRRLKAFQKCVGGEMEGKVFRSGNAVQDSRAVRSAFAGAAKSCAGRSPAR